jgi:hypothetical protein
LDIRVKISKIPSGGRRERKKRGMDEVGAKSKWGRGSPSFEGHQSTLAAKFAEKILHVQLD